jgi:gliding motility-associated-like protein
MTSAKAISAATATATTTNSNSNQQQSVNSTTKTNTNSNSNPSNTNGKKFKNKDSNTQRANSVASSSSSSSSSTLNNKQQQNMDQSISSNGENDVFVIRNIENYPNNSVKIYNRWGVIVYDVDSYGQDNKFFSGISDGRTTINRNEELPIGTYFYVIRYVNLEGVEKQRSGYLFINK